MGSILSQDVMISMPKRLLLSWVFDAPIKQLSTPKRSSCLLLVLRLKRTLRSVLNNIASQKETGAEDIYAYVLKCEMRYHYLGIRGHAVWPFGSISNSSTQCHSTWSIVAPLAWLLQIFRWQAKSQSQGANQKVLLFDTQAIWGALQLRALKNCAWRPFVAILQAPVVEHGSKQFCFWPCGPSKSF